MMSFIKGWLDYSKSQDCRVVLVFHQGFQLLFRNFGTFVKIAFLYKLQKLSLFVVMAITKDKQIVSNIIFC